MSSDVKGWRMMSMRSSHIGPLMMHKLIELREYCEGVVTLAASSIRLAFVYYSFTDSRVERGKSVTTVLFSVAIGAPFAYVRR